MAKNKARSKDSLIIDSEKLKATFINRKLVRSEVAEKFGFAPNWITNFMKRQAIPRYAAILLEKEYGIKYEEYKPDEPESNTQETGTICKFCDRAESFLVMKMGWGYCPKCGKKLV